jgi:diguanylate cyclase (GGDEF)-like protein
MLWFRKLSRGSAMREESPGFGRRFWWVSALGTLATMVLLVSLYEWQGRSTLRMDEERSDQQFARMLANSLWPQYGDFLTEVQLLPQRMLVDHPGHTDLRASMLAALGETSVLKVKAFSAQNGVTLFSTDARQIGELHLNDQLQAAMQGKGSSNLDHREQFLSIRGDKKDLYVFATYTPYYAPTRQQRTGTPDLILEVYSDVTPRMMAHRRNRFELVFGVALTLSLMYAMLWAIGRTANKRLGRAQQDRQQQEARIRHQAYHDALTGLPNRMHFGERCAERSQQPHGDGQGVLFIDLDRFKPINDSLGHRLGDAVLKKVAKRVRRTLRESEEVFRVGGDEFVALINTSDQPALEIAARRITAALCKPITVDGVQVTLSGSVGIARWPADDASLDQVVACADLAMYAAKRAGANQHAFYSATMRSETDDQVNLLAGMRNALVRREFVLHYQPRLGSTTDEIESLEALLRWQHPQEGLLQPGRFIPVLEDSPLIVEVGAWVLDTAAHQLAAWHAAGHKHLCVSVNVAARQFRAANFVQSVAQVLQRTGLPPHCLELEITEGQLIHDLDGAVQTIRHLKALGVMLSIDDFGTGYSSLSYLQTLPIDCLKIDRSFVKDLGGDGRHIHIARTITSLAHSMGMTVVAEGVETAAQARLLRSWGCEQLQGFLFSKPVPVPAIDQMLLVATQQTDGLTLRDPVSTQDGSLMLDHMSAPDWDVTTRSGLGSFAAI